MSHLCSRIYSRFLFSIGSGLNSSAKFSRTLITWLHSIYSSLFSPTPQRELSLSLRPASVSLPFHCQMMLCYGLPESFLISVQFSRSVMSGSLRPRGLQHARLPGPTPAPRACSNSCPSSWWWHPTILSSVPFSSCLHSFLASGSFPMSQFFASGGQSIGASASASVLPMDIQDWFPFGWIGWISLLPKGLSRVFSNTTVQKCLSLSSRTQGLSGQWHCLSLFQITMITSFFEFLCPSNSALNLNLKLLCVVGWTVSLLQIHTHLEPQLWPYL